MCVGVVWFLMGARGNKPFKRKNSSHAVLQLMGGRGEGEGGRMEGERVSKR